MRELTTKTRWTQRWLKVTRNLERVADKQRNRKSLPRQLAAFSGHASSVKFALTCQAIFDFLPELVHVRLV